MKIEYKKLFEMFVEKDGIRPNFMQPFLQNCKYYATDGFAAISMPAAGGEMLLKGQSKPEIDLLFSRIKFHEPNSISIPDLKKELIEKTPLVDVLIKKKEKCYRCGGDGSIKCDLGHEHNCDECDGDGHLIEKNPSGRKKMNKNEEFLFMGSVFKQKELMRLVAACELIGVDKVYKVSGEGGSAFCFKIHEFTILIMTCFFEEKNIDNYQKIELK